MDGKRPVQHLVVDTNALIHPIQLHTIAENFYAPPGVLAEARCHRSRVKVDTFPFEIRWTEPSSQALEKVVEESKLTGNYKELSAVDLKVIALTYDLWRQHSEGASSSGEQLTEGQLEDAVRSATLSETAASEVSNPAEEAPVLRRGNLPEGFCSDAESSDDEGWLTPESIDQSLSKMGAVEVAEGTTVGCISTDFAVQNVLLHMHLDLISLTGYRIKRLQSYILRCRACFNTTSNMEKEFCPKCGNKALHKCAVSVDKDGNQQVHLNWNRLTNLRGLKYSMAAPRGGKHAVVEQIVEDQRMPDQRVAKCLIDPLDDSPFAMRDVTSRSAMLGVHVQLNQQHRRRNPNEVRPATGTRKGKGKKK